MRYHIAFFVCFFSNAICSTADAQVLEPRSLTTRSEFTSLRTPTPQQALAVHSDGVETIKRVIIFFGRTCDPNVLIGHLSFTIDHGQNVYSSVTVCNDGSLESWHSVSRDINTLNIALSDFISKSSNGYVTVERGRRINIPHFRVTKNIKIDWWDYGDLSKKIYTSSHATSSGQQRSAIPNNLIGSSVYCDVYRYNQELFGGASRRADDRPDSFRLIFKSNNQVTIRGSDRYRNGDYNVTPIGNSIKIQMNPEPNINIIGEAGWDHMPTIDLNSFEWRGQIYTIILGVRALKYDRGSCE